MRAIFRVQWQQLRRNPFTLLGMMAMTVVMVLVLGSQNLDRLTVHVLPDPALSEASLERWLELLDTSGAFAFVTGSEERVLASLRSGSSGLAVRLLPDDWRIIARQNDPNAAVLGSFLGSTWREELMLRGLAGEAGAPELRAELAGQLAEPALRVVTAGDAAEPSFAFDSQVSTLLGMGLFFAMFTIMFSVNNILEERRNGIWDRVIQSPAPKLAMYSGHLAFSFMQGFLQITVIFLLFRYAFNVPLGSSFALVLGVIAAYTFAIVALSLLLAGIVANAQQMAVVIPIVAVSSAMLGGAYWPLEIVTSPFLLGISRAIPLTHAMDALKGIAYYGYGPAALLWPVSLLILFGVVCMGLGVQLIDRRS